MQCVHVQYNMNFCAFVIDVYINIFLAGVGSLLDGMPLAAVNMNNFSANYISIFGTSSNFAGVWYVSVCMCTWVLYKFASLLI